MTLAALTYKALHGENLSAEEATDAFTALLSGETEEADIAAFLLALKEKGETPEEITAAARALRASMQTLDAPDGAIDTCGTGGDGKHTLNISTAVAVVLAACGVPVAKHGNRSVSSKSGSADVLETLGVKLDAPIPVLETCLRDTHIAFMMAPQFHPAMKHVAAARKKLAVRTIFNLLGPLANPANAPYQLLGVYSAEWLTPMAETLRNLGSQRAWVVHGEDGMDELTITAPSRVASLEHGAIEYFTITPEDAGLQYHSAEALTGGDASHNAAAMQRLFAGEHDAYRDAVLLNAAAGLHIAGMADDLKTGAALAAHALDDGRVADTLKRWVATSNEAI